jgi:endoglucanase
MRSVTAVSTLGFFVASLPVWAVTPTTDIRVDQAGYLPGAPKLAMVLETGTAHAAQSFRLRRSGDNSVVYRGQLAAPAFDKDSGENLATADFSSFASPGKFYLEADGVGRSWDFAIAPDVFSRVYYLAMRAFYGQRCGTKVDLAPDFPEYKHGACHLDGAYHESSGKEGPHSSEKGWHDAGDYGRYVVNGGISTGTLLWAWELYGNQIAKIGLKIPESGNGVPDILNEIRWNLDWMISMQEPDGGVFHKQTSAHFAAFIMPEQDKLTSYVIGTGKEPFKSSCATGDLAAVAALASRAFRPYDAAYADRTLRSAENAWRWLQANPNVVFHNPPGISTGDYGDQQCGDEALWASAELWGTTGKDIYSQYFLQHYREFLGSIGQAKTPSWSMVAPLGLWGYALGNGRNAEAVDVIRQQTTQAAEAIVQRTGSDPYHVSLTTHDYIWGSNGEAANYSLVLLIANRFKPDVRYFQTALENLHYILGRNTFSLSWVTHVGENPFQHPHHRPSAADGVDAPWPGLMSGGPNPGRQDQVMKKLVSAGTLPARAYVDQTGAYACNEVAINWNAPLVFVLAAALPK